MSVLNLPSNPCSLPVSSILGALAGTVKEALTEERRRKRKYKVKAGMVD